MITDATGLAITTHSAATAQAIDALTLEFLRYGQNAAAILAAAAADPDCGFASTLAAAVHLCALTREGIAAARTILVASAAQAAVGTPRERLWRAGVDAWASQDGARAISAFDAIAAEWPRDLLAAKMLQLLLLNAGRFAEMAAAAERTLSTNGHVRYAHGIAAFARSQIGDHRGAERAGLHADALGPDPWAQHAVAHVFDARRDALRGRAWLERRHGDWEGCSSFLYTHNWWHSALFRLDLGDAMGALAIWDGRVWGRRKLSCQDQANAISLLIRLEVNGAMAGERWADVAAHARQRADDRLLGFFDLHYLYALARAGLDAEADALLASMSARAADTRPDLGGGWAEAALPAARGVVAYARGSMADAAGHLAAAQPHLPLLGASVTQRDLFRVMLRDAECGGRPKPPLYALVASRNGREDAAWSAAA
jgi:hypothetical protein